MTTNVLTEEQAGLYGRAASKWQTVLESDAFEPIADRHRKQTTAVILENTHREASYAPRDWAQSGLMNESVPTNSISAGNIATYDPILIALARRAMPNLVAYDLCGVQPMTGPTGLIFALRTRYQGQTGPENYYNEVNTAFTTIRAGNTTIGEGQTGGVPTGNTSTYNFAGGMTTAQLEGMGSNTTLAFPEMGFSIEKVTVTARGRALKAEYSMELAQDLKVIHGLDAETELANLLVTEVLAEINREIVRTINVTAVAGAQDDTTTPGIFDLDTDANGRWFGEKFKGLQFQVERERNAIAKATRRGKGNVLICSSDVASTFAMAGVLTNTPNIDRNNGLAVDDTGNTYVGVLNGGVKVYIDPYAAGHYMTVGYKGNGFDAGLFYAPYVPLQMVRAVSQDTFQPKIGFKTRYGIVANPFSAGANASDGSLVANQNVYYRRTLVSHVF